MQYARFARRLMQRADARAIWKMGWNLGLGGANSVRLHKKRLRAGKYFPPFLYVSVINSCNLRCQGCWVDVAHDRQELDLPTLDRLIGEAKEMGNRFFGLVGGEPFMHSPTCWRSPSGTRTATSRSSPTASSSPPRRRRRCGGWRTSRR